MSALFCVLWLVFIAVVSLLAPFIYGQQSLAMNFNALLEAPSVAHWFGTDSLGRDLFARILCGSGVSLGVAFIACLIAFVVGTCFGMLSGYFRGWTDKIVSAFCDAMLCFPVFFLILAVTAFLGSSLWTLAGIIGLTGWMGAARLVRAQVLSLKEKEFVLSARALGLSDWSIMSRHLLPNALGPAVIHGVLMMPAAILAETGLSFLGIGIQPPTASLGNILAEGRTTLGVAWWLTLFPGLMILLTLLSLHVTAKYLEEKILK